MLKKLAEPVKTPNITDNVAALITVEREVCITMKDVQAVESSI
jgi:hypothetical protein